MSYQLQPDGKKSRTSFWGKLFGTAKKSSNKNKSIMDASFARNSSLYHSFHCSSAPPLDPQDEGEVFTTLENSALAEMHKDAGIIFLNKNPLGMGGPLKEDDKKVQFVPTPQNKYYHVDVKAAPSKRSSKRVENKENLLEQSRPSKPILRFGKSQENVSKREDGSDVGGSKIRANAVDDPMVKNAMTSMPRTSTKLALFDRKNGSMPHLNVSGIPQYGSLPRSMAYRGEHPPTETRSDDTKIRMAFPINVRQRHASDAEYSGQLGNRMDKNPRLSVQDLPRQFEQNSAAVKLRSGSNYNISHRQSIGDPLVYARNWGCGNDRPSYGRNQELGNTSYEKAMQQQCRGRSAKSEGLRKKQQVLPITSTNVKCFNQQIPNKAINEIGLPLTTFKIESFNIPKQRSRSQSPHYIPLTETFSGKSLPLNRPESNGCPQLNCLDPMDRNFLIPTMQSNSGEKWQEKPGPSNIPPNLLAIKMREDPEYSHFLGQARRQLMRSSMYSQKRKTANKVCKVKSKECEDGFSSMADDECSFNCSCSSCMLRISKESRRSKFPMQPSKDDKYFFICTDIKEENETEICPDIPPREKNVVKVNHKEPENDSNKAKTWYECNDSFCTTPKVDQSTPQKKPTQKTPKDKIVESIYENITQIINSATKRNLKTQDLERMFSTPLSKSKILTAGKVCRSLFSSRENLQGTKEVILSPAQSPMIFSDSVILLQEIFQKLSQECRELLRPDVSAPETPKQSCGSKYVDDLVKNLKSSSSISEGDFATIIGGIAQNIFLEAKLKQTARSLTHSASLPDLYKDVEEPVPNIRSSLENLNKDSQEPVLQIRSSLEDLNLEDAADSGFRTESSGCCTRTTDLNFTTVEGRELPEGWSRSPTAESNTTSTSKDDSKSSESDMQLLENTIRLGMGLSPVKKAPKASFYACSPAKASKFKSRDVLSCKGKLKIKIYHNSGLVTVHVMRAAKLHRLNGRDLNPYIKISMVPDTAKRVHWRTTVIKGQKGPVFNQKFSFEVLDEDTSKRLVFSVWHRDFAKERSELVGCMSFSVKHVLDHTHKIDGWYRLLREGFGTQKHFAAHKNSCYLKRLK